jgi:hypothetical protein
MIADDPQAEMPQDFLDQIAVLDKGDDSHWFLELGA